MKYYKLKFKSKSIFLLGRFPQVSGIFFAFDTNKAPYNRIDPTIIKVNKKYLNLTKVR